MAWAKFGEGLREGVCLFFLCCIEMYLFDSRFQRFNASKHWSLTTMPQLWLCKTPKNAREKLKHLQCQYILHIVERKKDEFVHHLSAFPIASIRHHQTKSRHNSKCLVSTVRGKRCFYLFAMEGHPDPGQLPPTPGLPGEAPPLVWLLIITAAVLWWLWPWLERVFGEEWKE